MICGVATAIVWELLVTGGVLTEWATGNDYTSLADLSLRATKAGIDAVIPAVMLSVVVLVAVSLAGAKPTEERANAI